MRGARAAQLDAAQGPAERVDGERLTADVIALAGQYGCYGYRTALLRQAGWSIQRRKVRAHLETGKAEGPPQKAQNDGTLALMGHVSVCSGAPPIKLVLRLRRGSHP
jgi:hypothetical protein